MKVSHHLKFAKQLLNLIADSGVASPKIGGVKNLEGPKYLISGELSILFRKTPPKAQNDYIF